MPSVFPENVRPADILGDAARDTGLGNVPMLKALLKASQAALDPDLKRTRAATELNLDYAPSLHGVMGPEVSQESLDKFAPSLLPGTTVGHLIEDLAGMEVEDAPSEPAT
jgi:hypothetical protein